MLESGWLSLSLVEQDRSNFATENRPATWLVPFEEATAECFFHCLVRLFDEKLAVVPRFMPVNNLPPLNPSFYERDYLSPVGIAHPISLENEAQSRIAQTSRPEGEVVLAGERLGLRLVQDRHDRETNLHQSREQYERRLSAADHDLRRLLNEVGDCNQMLVEADRNLRRLAAEVDEREQRLVEADRGMQQLTASIEERDRRLLKFEADQGGRS